LPGNAAIKLVHSHNRSHDCTPGIIYHTT